MRAMTSVRVSCQPGTQVSCHRSCPTLGGNGITRRLGTRTGGRLELCTSTRSSLRFLLRLVLTGFGTCIEMSGGCPLALRLGLQYLLRILLFLLLAGIVVV